MALLLHRSSISNFICHSSCLGACPSIVSPCAAVIWDFPFLHWFVRDFFCLFSRFSLGCLLRWIFYASTLVPSSLFPPLTFHASGRFLVALLLAFFFGSALPLVYWPGPSSSLSFSALFRFAWPVSLSTIRRSFRARRSGTSSFGGPYLGPAHHLC